MPEIIHKKESYAIIGACFEVYNEKGCGFLEPVYQECLGIEFEYQRIPAIAKPSLVSALTDEHRAQTVKLPARNRSRARPPSEFWTLPQAGIRTHCEDSAHQTKNRPFRCLPLIYSRQFACF